jgi:hypothetical protein
MGFVQNVELHKNASFSTKILGIFIESVSQNILCWSFTELNATQPSTDVFILLQDGAMTIIKMTLSITTFSIMTLSITTFSIMTLSIMTLSKMTLSITTLNITFKNVTLNIKKLSTTLKI